MPPTELDYNRESTAHIRCQCMAVILETWPVAALGSTFGNQFVPLWLPSSTKDKFGIKMTRNSHSITFHYFVSTVLGSSTLFSAICRTLSKRDSAVKPKHPPTPPKSDMLKLYTLIGQPGNLVWLKTEIEQGEAKWKIGLAHRSTRASSQRPFKFRGTLMQHPPSRRRCNYHSK